MIAAVEDCVTVGVTVTLTNLTEALTLEVGGREMAEVRERSGESVKNIVVETVEQGDTSPTLTVGV